MQKVFFPNLGLPPFLVDVYNREGGGFNPGWWDMKSPNQGQRNWRLSVVGRDPCIFPALPRRDPGHPKPSSLRGCLYDRSQERAPRIISPAISSDSVCKPSSSRLTFLLHISAGMEAPRPGKPCCCHGNHEARGVRAGRKPHAASRGFPGTQTVAAPLYSVLTSSTACQALPRPGKGSQQIFPTWLTALVLPTFPSP